MLLCMRNSGASVLCVHNNPSEKYKDDFLTLLFDALCVRGLLWITPLSGLTSTALSCKLQFHRFSFLLSFLSISSIDHRPAFEIVYRVSQKQGRTKDPPEFT